MLVRRYLHSRGYRYRVNVRRLPGTPDIVLRKYRTVIFINGCFWHGHEGCRYYVPPKRNSQFWQQKIERSQCELKPKNHHTTLQALEQTLNKIYQLNNSVKVTTPYPDAEESSGI